MDGVQNLNNPVINSQCVEVYGRRPVFEYEDMGVVSYVGVRMTIVWQCVNRKERRRQSNVGLSDHLANNTPPSVRVKVCQLQKPDEPILYSVKLSTVIIREHEAERQQKPLRKFLDHFEASHSCNIL